MAGSRSQRPHRNVVACIDGTWNSGIDLHPTNVWKLYRAADRARGPFDVCRYFAGVGTRGAFTEERADDRALDDFLAARAGNDDGRWGRVAGGVGGHGLARRIRSAYAFIAQSYEPGDRLFLFGFSRGAFAVRSLVGFIDRVGLLFADRLALVEQAWRLYEDDVDPRHLRLARYVRRVFDRPLLSSDDPESVRVHFLGVWDTVGALGLPDRFGALSAPFTEFHDVDVPPNVVRGRHALAIHELRASFEPLPWRFAPGRDLVQAWFPGAHADVGGGYAPSESGLANESLRWMARAAEDAGLALDTAADWRRDDVPRRLHHGVRRWFVAARPRVRATLCTTGRDDPRLVASCRFHASARDWLADPASRPYRFALPWVNAALVDADTRALQRLVEMRLLGHALVGS